LEKSKVPEKGSNENVKREGTTKAQRQEEKEIQEPQRHKGTKGNDKNHKGHKGYAKGTGV